MIKLMEQIIFGPKLNTSFNVNLSVIVYSYEKNGGAIPTTPSQLEGPNTPLKHPRLQTCLCLRNHRHVSRYVYGYQEFIDSLQICLKIPKTQTRKPGKFYLIFYQSFINLLSTFYQSSVNLPSKSLISTLVLAQTRRTVQ